MNPGTLAPVITKTSKTMAEAARVSCNFILHCFIRHFDTHNKTPKFASTDFFLITICILSLLLLCTILYPCMCIHSNCVPNHCAATAHSFQSPRSIAFLHNLNNITHRLPNVDTAFTVPLSPCDSQSTHDSKHVYSRYE